MFCCISLHFIKDDFLHSGADVDLFPCNVFRLQMVWTESKHVEQIPVPRSGSSLTMAWIVGHVFTSLSPCIPFLDEGHLVSVFLFFISYCG